MPGVRYESTGFGKQLESLRKAAGFSKVDLAEKVGASRNTLGNIESGRNEPTWPLVIALADALGVSTEAFRPAPVSAE